MTRLTADVPVAYPGGPSHKAGELVFLPTTVRDNLGNIFGFITPNPVSLALNTAIASAQEAIRLRRTIAFRPMVTPMGSGKEVAIENLPILYEVSY